MDENSEALRKAEARRRRLLQQKESRMKKILGENASEPPEMLPAEAEVLEDVPVLNLKSPIMSLDDLVDDATTIRQRTTVKETSSTADNTEFPRKVSLISTPVDFKTVKLNQEQRNSWTLVIVSFLWYLQSNISSLASMSVVILSALISSYIKLNVCLPFLLTISFLGLFNFATKPSPHNLSCIKMLLCVADYFIIFIASYIIGLIFV